MRTPQKFRSEFADLPPKMQQKLIEILKRNGGGDNFDASLLLEPPRDDFVGSDFTKQNFDDEFEVIFSQMGTATHVIDKFYNSYAELKHSDFITKMQRSLLFG